MPKIELTPIERALLLHAQQRHQELCAQADLVLNEALELVLAQHQLSVPPVLKGLRLEKSEDGKPILVVPDAEVPHGETEV